MPIFSRCRSTERMTYHRKAACSTGRTSRGRSNNWFRLSQHREWRMTGPRTSRGRRETGRRVRLVRPPDPAVPPAFPRTVLTMPWWITEQPVPPDAHCGDRHVHVDHQYVALVTDPDEMIREPEYPVPLGSAGRARRPRDVRRRAAARHWLVAVVPMLGASDVDTVTVMRLLAGDRQS